MGFLFVKTGQLSSYSNSGPKRAIPYRKLFLLLFFLTFFSGSASSVAPLMEVFSGPVGAEGLPEGWKALEFPKIERHTLYTVETDGTNSFLKAESRNSASGLYKEVDIDLY
jgi:hypothetical protein